MAGPASNSELFSTFVSLADDIKNLLELTIDQAFYDCKITMDFKFWLDMEECLKCISQVITKLSLACMDPPLPTSKELWPFLKTLKLSLTKLSFYCATYSHYLYGMSLKVSLTETTEKVFDGVIKLLRHIVEPDSEKRKRYLTSAGYIWDVAENFPKLPKDNKEAVLIKMKEVLHMVSDACDELTEAQTVSGLIKATKFCLIKLIGAIEKNAKTDYNYPNELPKNPSQENPDVEIPNFESAENESILSRFFLNKGQLDLNSLQSEHNGPMTSGDPAKKLCQLIAEAGDTISSDHLEQSRSIEVAENNAELDDQNESSEDSNEQMVIRTKFNLSNLIEAMENDLKADNKNEFSQNSSREIPIGIIPSVGAIQNEMLLNELLRTKVGQLDLISMQSERLSSLTDCLVTMLYPPITDVNGITSTINELEANVDWIISLAKKSHYIPKDENNSWLDFVEKAFRHNAHKSFTSIETFVASRNNLQQ
ncbi:hypothetical protein HELRODRAFT_167539 [Helobdella robusta]|uniref:Cyclin-D1-binding protein 1-like N-terminal domain-containing protein n=1 Tax=Helobdella robusta TaxID=6412 RepID=T1EZG8_HELRO|nr:hypothetical protein HELRODRAFT_167539 [Helobdella robusta]ESO11020.1 hypothetical protein HELRODRAFT_167539 [Helobdella robusta]